MVDGANVKQLRELRLKERKLVNQKDELLHRRNTLREKANALKESRDAKHLLAKESVQKGREAHSQRDGLRKDLNSARSRRRGSASTRREAGGKIKELKERRDLANKLARGSMEYLSTKLVEVYGDLIERDLALDQEIRQFDFFFTLRERYSAKIEADECHREIQKLYDALKTAQKSEQGSDSDLTALEKENSRFHAEGVEAFKGTSQIRAAANEDHKAMIGHYQEMDELKKEIDGVFEELRSIRKEIKKIERGPRQHRGRKAQKKEMADIRKRAETGGALSLDDLSKLMKSGGLGKE